MNINAIKRQFLGYVLKEGDGGDGGEGGGGFGHSPGEGSNYGGGYSSPSSGGYSFSGTTPGLSAPTDNSSGYGFAPGTTAGITGVDSSAISGNLGNGLIGATGASTPSTDYSLSTMFPSTYTPQQAGVGLNAGYGEGMQANAAPASVSPYGLSSGNYGEGLSGTTAPASSWDHPAVKVIRTILGMTPVGALANTAIDGLRGNDVTQSALGMLGMPGKIAGAAYGALNSSNPAASIGGNVASNIAGTVGNAFAGPAGAQLAGGMMNTGLQQGAQQTASIGAFGTGSPVAAGQASASLGGLSPSTGGNGFNLSSLLAGLGSAYLGSNASNNSGAVQSNAANTNTALQGQMSTLAGMYSPDSPYAKQLQATLAAKDAAAGRNSQYGARSVDLQARLAALAPQVATSMAGLGNAASTANTQAIAANNQDQVVQAQRQAQLLSLLKSSGLMDKAQSGLSNLFTSSSPSTSYTPSTSTDSYSPFYSST